MPLPASDEEVFWWSKTLGFGTGGLVLLWKIVRMFRTDERSDQQAQTIADGNTRLVGGLEKEIERLGVVIADLDRRLTSIGTLRYEAEGEAAVLRKRLDAAEAAVERANRRAAAAHETAEILKAECTATEMINRRLVLRLREAGIELPGDGEMP